MTMFDQFSTNATVEYDETECVPEIGCLDFSVILVLREKVREWI